MIANMFVVFGLFGGLFLFPIYLQNIRFQSAFQAGLILLPQALAAMVSMIIGGRLVDRIGVRTVMIPSITPASSADAKGAAPLDLASPMNGTVLQVPAVQGQNVAPGLTLVVVTDLSSVYITAYVDENAISNVSVGHVDIHIDAYSDTSLTGHVAQIVQATAGQFSLLPNQDPTSGNFTKVGQRIPVVISLDGNAGKTIMPGMSAEVTIHLH